MELDLGKSVLDTFRRIHIDHVFHCLGCQMFWLAKDLYKNHDKKYVCVKCGHEVKDVTFTQQGQQFMQMIRPNSGAK